MNLPTLQLAHLLAFTLPKPLAWVGTICMVFALFALFAWYKWTQVNKALDDLFEWELGPERDSKNISSASAEPKTKTELQSNDPLIGSVEKTNKGGGVPLSRRRPTL